MSSSSPEEDQQPEEKKLKLANKNDPFYLFDYDREAYLKKLYDFSIVGGDDPNATDDEERDFTEEEAKLYYDAIAATEGFDVPDFPKEVNFCGMIIPLPVDDDTLEYLLPFSVAAIGTFNDYYGTNYKVVQVEKAMNQTSRGINYYITFQAKVDDDNSDASKSDDDNSDTATTFEALVLKGIPKKKGENATEVIFCREKGTKKESKLPTVSVHSIRNESKFYRPQNLTFVISDYNAPSKFTLSSAVGVDIKVGKVSSHSSFEIVAPEENLESEDEEDGSVGEEAEESEDEESGSVDEDAEAKNMDEFVDAAEEKLQSEDQEGGIVEEKAKGV
ncbi:hypothetical protein PTKIN_Ptkin19aG0071500 [Pterospermum kingtungense]